MKRISLISIFLLLAIIPYYCKAQWNFSITGDIQWCREKITMIQPSLAVQPYTIQSKYVVLPEAGAQIDYQLSRAFFLRSGLILDGEGVKYKDPGNTAAPDKIIYHRYCIYLDIPLFIMARPTLFHTNRFYIGCGPFIRYGLGGWYKNEDVATHQVLTKGKVRFRGKNGDFLKDFDNGINFLLGYRVSQHFSIKFIYQYGLMDIYNGPSTAYGRSIEAGIDYKIK